ncbi:XRE family transcriptional regulator [Ralstonia solanacearum]
MLYRPPTVAQMKRWKDHLQLSGAQMARILGLKSARRWRDYADENKPQGIPPANLFMAAALMTLPQGEIDRVLTTMREVGAIVDLDASPDSSAPGGETQP